MIKIELPSSHVVTKGPRDKSWSASVTADVSALSPEIVARLAIHGLHQKIADAAAGATNEAEAVAAMQKAVDAVVAGEWTSRVAGAGVDEETKVARSVTMAVAKTSMGAKSPEWAEFTGLSDEAQAEKLDAWFQEHIEVLGPAAATELADRRAKAARKAEVSKAVKISL
jgi:hypothetical protein